jgi:hypothetical protein
VLSQSNPCLLQVPVLLVFENTSLREAVDITEQPWFRLYHFLQSWRADADLEAFMSDAKVRDEYVCDLSCPEVQVLMIVKCCRCWLRSLKGLNDSWTPWLASGQATCCQPPGILQ